jgi:hypothetical protein
MLLQSATTVVAAGMRGAVRVLIWEGMTQDLEYDGQRYVAFKVATH